MKIAFTTSGQTLDSPLDSRFGRTSYFLIYDTEKESIDIIDNSQNQSAMQGAGIQAAQAVAKSGASILITGHVGPKAFQVLSSAKIQIYSCDSPTIKQALESFKNDDLKAIGQPDVPGHWR